MTNYTLSRKGLFASVFLSLLTLLASTGQLPAAITPTGNVEPSYTWTNTTSGYIGNTADGSLVVDAGSVLSSNYSYIGYTSGVSGTVTVTGAGSMWDSYRLYFGFNGGGTLSIEAGGKVNDAYGYLGYNTGSTGTVTVTGVGSIWDSDELYIGNSGSGTLTIAAGGQVTDLYGYLGYNSGSTGTATITGVGSQWTNSRLYVGGNGSGTLTVTDGGVVTANTLYASLSDLAGNGVITTKGAVLDRDFVFDGTHGFPQTISFGSGGTINLTMDGTGDLGAGYKGTGTLRVSEGITVASTDGYLGYKSGSSGSATVTGAGSNWNNYNLYVGYNGSGTLNIEAGGQVVSKYRSYLGYYSGSMGTATVTGVGSMWTTGVLSVGGNGSGALNVTDGGVVTTGTLYASLSDLAGNGVINTNGAVLDADFVFDAAHGAQTTVPFGSGGRINLTLGGKGALGAGYKGIGSLRVTDGISVNAPTGFLGYHSGSTGLATISGAGSKWTDCGSLYIGYSGNGALTIEAGGQVSNNSYSYNGYISYIGYNAGSTGTATITGVGSRWSYIYGLDLYVGNRGNGVLNIAAGGQVNSYLGGHLGFYSGSKGTATVSGAGSVWNTGDLIVGNFGSGELNIEAGGQVSNQNGYLGYSSGSTGTATVTGVGSTWTNRSSISTGSNLNVGYSGSGVLNIAAGGQVSNSYGYLGYNSGSTGTVTVTGSGSMWINSGSLCAGYSGNGMLTIAAGGQVKNTSGHLGYKHGSAGAVTVTGEGSMWTNSGDLYLGYSGRGALTIEAGGQVSNRHGYLGYSGSSGTVIVTGAGSRWTNSGYLNVSSSGSGTLTVTDGGVVTAETLYASLRDLSGDGTILVSKGAVLDADLVFESPYGTQVTVPFGSGGAIKVTLDGTGRLSLGYKGTGSLRISNGIAVVCASGGLGYLDRSTGMAIVTGVGSMWINSSNLCVGNYGDGILIIEAGGQISNKDGYLGFGSDSNSRSKGTATVTGAGSMWTNSSTLYVGYEGNGILHIRDGGMVTANSVSINSKSLLTIDAGYGSVLSVNNGTGSISNSGKVRFVTGPQPMDGSQYSPIAGLWSGTYQALGGTWDTTNHVFTVSQALNGVSGTPVAVDLAQQQRVLIGESSLNRTVGASFLAKTGTGKSFNLTAIALADVPALGGLLQPWESVFNAWTFTAEGAGYVATDPVYLSFSVPANMSRDQVILWKLTGDTWSAFSADDLTVTGGYASFTSTGLSGYAVTVPEPAAVVLVLTAIMGGLFVWRRRG